MEQDLWIIDYCLWRWTCAFQMILTIIMSNHRENHHSHHSSLWRRARTVRLPHHLALLPPHHRLLAAVSLLCHQGGPGELIILGHIWSLLLLFYFWFNHIPQSWKQEYFIQCCATFRSKSNNEKHFATLRIWHIPFPWCFYKHPFQLSSNVVVIVLISQMPN